MLRYSVSLSQLILVVDQKNVIFIALKNLMHLFLKAQLLSVWLAINLCISQM